jgi:hypothetical protein
MYLQFFPIYGFMLGLNYWNTDLDPDNQETDETEHLVQFMIGIIGISFHYWIPRD